MNNAELLSAISDLLDQKLEEKLEQKLEQKLEEKLDQKFDQKLQPIYARLDRVEEHSHATRQILEENVLPRLDRVEEHSHSTRKLLVDSVIPKLHATRILLENDIQPRLQNIEACYIDAARHYLHRTEQIDTLSEDVDILKKTVRRHSMILQKAGLMPT